MRGVHVARLQAQDRGSGDGWNGIGPHAALGIHGHAHDAIAAEAEQAERFQQRRMHFVADDDSDGRRAEESLRFHRPAGLPEHVMTGCCQCGEIRHGGAGDERALRGIGKSEQLDHPSQRHVLHARHAGRNVGESCILIPRRRKPVRGESSRQTASDDEAEESRAGHCDRCRRDELIQAREHSPGFGALSRQRLVQRLQAGYRRGRRRDRSRAQSIQISNRAPCGIFQQRRSRAVAVNARPAR